MAWSPAFLVLAVLLTACGRSPKLNHFVVSAGYTGPIAVVSDPSLIGQWRYEEGRFIHTVPATAIVCAPSRATFHGGFQLTAEYTDGSVIYSHFVGLPAAPDASSIRIEGLGSWGAKSPKSNLDWFGLGDAATIESLRGLSTIYTKMPEGVEITSTYPEDFAYLRRYCGDDDVQPIIEP